MPYDVLLVEDHLIVRDGIKKMLEGTPEFRVAGEASNGADSIQFCKRARPHLVLMDLSMKGLTGIEATQEILRHSPNTRVIILSQYDDEDSVVSALRGGARGFVLKDATFSDLIDALRTVAKGGSYLSPQVSDRLLNRIQEGNLKSKSLPPVLEGLSPRELQVLRMVAEGKTSKEIAVLLNLGLQTVRSYRKTMMKKLGVSNIAGLTQLAIASGLARMPVLDSRMRGA